MDISRVTVACAACLSTTGVYGDCGGAWIDETRAPQPANLRAKRRVSAEQNRCGAPPRGRESPQALRGFQGIYAGNRLPLARLEKPASVVDADGVYTSHIHAGDLAAILVRLATHGRPARAIHAS